MTRHRPSPFALRALLVLALGPFPFALAHAQSASATLSGTVFDANGAVVPDAIITLTEIGTGLQRTAKTNDEGHFTIPLLKPSTYILHVEHQGFLTAEVRDIVLNVNDNVALRIPMRVGNVSETVNVTAEAPLIDESPAVSTVVDRQFVANLPLNGRSFNALIALTPGVVLTPAGSNEQGQFSINGQRADANYFTIDGVSANASVSPAGFNPGQASAGSVPSLGATGGTNNLISVDALQEFRIQTSTFAPEFGRTPGGQVQMITRGGTNEFRGSLFEFFRNDKLDANDFFANANRQPRPAERQNDFGGVFGGPIIKNKTFFFFSYEGLRLRLPQFQITDVPSVSARQSAVVGMQPFLSAFPIPNGAIGNNGFAKFAASFSNPASLDHTSIRIDHNVGSKMTLFGRYSNSPSQADLRGAASAPLSLVNVTRLKIQSLTFGTTWFLNNRSNNELRLNFTHNRGRNAFQQTAFGGAVPLNDNIFPAPFTFQDAFLALVIVGGTNTQMQVGKVSGTIQRQINVVDNFSVVSGQHQLKFGIDYRRLSPFYDVRKYDQQAVFVNVTGAGGAATARSAISGIPNSSNNAAIEQNTVYFKNLSAYFQDTWRATPRLVLTYGLRWELNPSPQGKQPLVTVNGVDNILTATLAPLGTPLYKTTYDNFAPRVGASYQLFQKTGRETIVRGGFGIFYDLGFGVVGNGVTSFPYLRRRTFPFNAANTFPLPLANTTTLPFDFNQRFVSQITIADPNLKLPRVYEWNAAIEQALGSNQTISASYIGSAGRRLLRQEFVRNTAAPNFVEFRITRNQATSDYNAFQLQLNRRLSRGTQILASYTLAKSLDIASSDSLLGNLPVTNYDPNLDRGPSDFDIRHAFSAAVTYNIPTPHTGAFVRYLLRDWSIDTIATARSAAPVNITSSLTLPGVGTFSGRPDLVTGVPLYVNNPNVAGGRLINIAAFAVPATVRQGTLGRNALRGFSLYQIDFAMRRRFNLTERVNLQMHADFFNIFNHPNFGDPGANGNFTNDLSSSQFGQSINMFGRSLGTGGVTGGLNPLYQVGGPRSIQFGLKLQF